jgi:hypothetical protein
MLGLLVVLAVVDVPTRSKGVCLPVRVEARRDAEVARIVREADAIWAPYGIRIVPAAGACPAGLYDGPLLVVRLDARGPASSIGRVVFEGGEPRLPIALSSSAADRLARGADRTRLSLDPFAILDHTDVVLGRALAHEIGHILLGREHAASGLMRPQLRPEDVGGAADRRFALTDEQRRRLAQARKCPLMQPVADARAGR